MKKNYLVLIGLSLLTMIATGCQSTPMDQENSSLRFNPEQYEVKTLTTHNGKTIKYRAYEHLYYVTNIEDSTYQYLNFYVPESVATGDQNVPILFRTRAGGYMAGLAGDPSNMDATGRALEEGYAVCIPGSRGHNSVVERNGEKIHTGRGPAAILDLKAAVRYLRYNDALMPGDAERIFTDGTSAGGAMSALLGATGNSPLYDPYFEKMGVPDVRDDVFAAICYCPMVDLDHADMGYEWLYKHTNTTTRHLPAEMFEVSEELAAAFPAYLRSLELKAPDGTLLTEDNYLDYIKSFLIASAQKARDEAFDIPDSTGVKLNTYERMGHVIKGEFVVDIDMPAYLSYVVTTQPLKNPPAFDPVNVTIDVPSPENQVFGDEKGSVVNFSEYSFKKVNGADKERDPELVMHVRMMNPMPFLYEETSVKAPHWYIRHGARDRDSGFTTPVNLATKLMNEGYDVDFSLPWNRPHFGDYNLNELFKWMKEVSTEK